MESEDTARALGRHRRLADSDSDSDNDTPSSTPKNILTAAKACDHCPKPFRLIARAGTYTSITDLSSLKNLDYIDVSNNKLTSITGISNLPRLKTLNLSNNNLSNLTPILKIDSLRILNVSNNPLPTLDWLIHSRFAPFLIALVATHVDLVSLDGLSTLRDIETIILSHNDLEEIKDISKLPVRNLKKISLSHNRIRHVPESIGRFESLKELRISHNLITELPKEGILRQLRQLRILDIGHNRMEDLNVLGVCHALQNVNVSGNPGCDLLNDGNNIVDAVRRICKGVEVVDGIRVAGGRRKDRINRLRVAAGLGIESDRRFARAPPVQAVKRMLQKEEDDKEGKGIVQNKKRQAEDEDKNEEEQRKEVVYVEKEEDAENVKEKGIKTKRKRKKVALDDDAKAEAFKLLERAGRVGEINTITKTEREGVADEQPEQDQSKRTANVKSDGDDADAEDADHEAEKDKVKLKKEKELRKKRKRDNDDEADNDAIDAESFLKEAKSKVTAKSMGGAKVKDVGDIVKKKKKKRRGATQVEEVVAVGNLGNDVFGQGGESQW